MALHVTISKDDYIQIGENIRIRVARKKKGDGTNHSKHFSVSIEAPKEIKVNRVHNSNFQEESNEVSGNI
tara:strand:- start:1855 stop:2064 length:210 start_codon:yes stop_codon:yes gene_type:complete